MDEASWTQFDEIVATATQGVLELDIAPAQEGCCEQCESNIVAVIGFGGEKLRGALVLQLTQDVLAKSYPSAPAAGATISDVDLRDWCGELANLLLGRVKSQLLGYDVVIQPSTPTTLSGADLTFGRPSAASPRISRAYRNECALQLRLEVETTDGTELRSVRRSRQGVAMEGEMLLF